MSEISVFWTPIAPSRRRAILLLAALAVSGGVLAATLVAALTRPGPLAVLGAALAGAGAALLAGAARRNASDPRIWWRIRGDGAILVRVGRDPEAPADPAYASTGLIVLQHGRRLTAVWRDAAPAPAFRRLSAAVRWPSARARVAPDDARPDAAERT